MEAIARVKEFLRPFGRDGDVLEFDQSSATVELAALAVGVEGARIAKSLSFRYEEGGMVLVCAGDARTDNKKFREEFGCKARMLSPEEAEAFTGYRVGGVCPFALPEEVPVFLDISMRRFDSVYPACGSANSAIKISCEDLEKISGARRWVDVCKDWE